MSARPPCALLSLVINSSKVNIATVLQNLQLWLVRLDRRPSRDAKLRDDIYFIEVRSEKTNDLSSWEKQLHESISKVVELTQDIKLLGLW